MKNRSKQVSFAASEDLYDALEMLAITYDRSIAEIVRKIVVDHLRDEEVFGRSEPPTTRAALAWDRRVERIAQ